MESTGHGSLNTISPITSSSCSRRPSRREETDFYLESGAGLFPTLDTITAEIASREPFPGAPSIAAHCAHLDYYVRVNHSSIVGREQRSTGHRVGAFKASELASGRPSSRVCGAATSI
jgi:hypothetical protein